MKLSRRGKSSRRVRHTKRTGKKLRYKSKKFRASKRYHRGHKRTYKRGKRLQRGGDKCDTIVKVESWMRDNINVNESMNSNYAHIVKVNLKYQKDKFFSTVENSDFGVVLKILDTGTIYIKFSRLGDDKGIKHVITDLAMLSSPGLSNWKNMEGVKYSFDFPENKGVFNCIREAIVNKYKELFPNSTSGNVDNTVYIPTAPPVPPLASAAAPYAARATAPTFAPAPAPAPKSAKVLAAAPPPDPEFANDTRVFDLTPSISKRLQISNPGNYVGRFVLQVNRVNKKFDVYTKGTFGRSASIILFGIPETGDTYDTEYNISTGYVLSSFLQENKKALSSQSMRNIYDTKPISSSESDTFPATPYNITEFRKIYTKAEDM